MRGTILAAACVLIGTCIAASASPREGQIEIGGETSGSLGTSLADGGGSEFKLEALGGYFMSRELEIKAFFSYQKIEDVDGFGALLAGADYLWPSRGAWLPYAGGAIGISFGGDSEVLGNVHGGARYFFSNSLSTNIEGRYTFAWSHLGEGMLEVMVGLSVYFDHF